MLLNEFGCMIERVLPVHSSDSDAALCEQVKEVGSLPVATFGENNEAADQHRFIRDAVGIRGITKISLITGTASDPKSSQNCFGGGGQRLDGPTAPQIFSRMF
jgi:hypothetical protein